MYFFNGWVILHSVYVPQLSYPFICWRTSRLLPCPSYCKQCNELWSTCASFNSSFLSVYAQQWDCMFLLAFKHGPVHVSIPVLGRKLESFRHEVITPTVTVLVTQNSNQNWQKGRSEDQRWAGTQDHQVMETFEWLAEMFKLYSHIREWSIFGVNDYYDQIWILRKI